MKVKDVMRQPFVIEKDMSLSEVAQIMSSKNVGSLIFLADGKIKGLITDTDLVRNFDSKAKASVVMSKEVVTIGPKETLDDAATKMRKNSIKRLPVVDNNKLVGIVTITDLIANAEELEEDFFFDD